jgi:hypothetical protein
LIYEGKRSGEDYFSRNGKALIFLSGEIVCGKDVLSVGRYGSSCKVR